MTYSCIKVPEELTLVAFADDVAVTITREYHEELTAALSKTMNTINSWMRTVGLLELNPKQKPS